ncbi:TIGR02301 family protein [Methylocapsa polymorpha]|uniref:TIGR02301 family protein n=1 Tax=Methylocapsa polymorpha TaxID=3080828 RepID=A0ABZ0HT98_9HYPH|nr:TIGR02301 family protein [Methylocapsa sp. RX1]
MNFFRRQTRQEASPGDRRGKTIPDLSLRAISGAIAVALILAPPAQAQQTHKSAHSRPHAKSASAKSAHAKPKSPEAKPAEPPAPGPETPASEPPPPPYEAQVLRLAEILGALSYLDELCGSGDSAEWRARMQALLEAEAKTTFRKERLAGTFNRSFRGYERSYRVCTPNAQAVINRFLAEGGRLTHEVVNRFSAS